METAPLAITLHRKSAQLELQFPDEEPFFLAAEYLRVYSPSAEVRGHGKGQEILQTGKRDVLITGIEPMGNYAIRLDFDDGHKTGIYSWGYLHELCHNNEKLWQEYIEKLESAGETRVPLPEDTQVIKIQPAPDK